MINNWVRRVDVRSARTWLGVARTWRFQVGIGSTSSCWVRIATRVHGLLNPCSNHPLSTLHWGCVLTAHLNYYLTDITYRSGSATTRSAFLFLFLSFLYFDTSLYWRLHITSIFLRSGTLIYHQCLIWRSVLGTISPIFCLKHKRIWENMRHNPKNSCRLILVSWYLIPLVMIKNEKLYVILVQTINWFNDALFWWYFQNYVLGVSNKLGCSWWNTGEYSVACFLYSEVWCPHAVTFSLGCTFEFL